MKAIKTASQSMEEARVVRELQGRVRLNRTNITSYGSVGEAQGYNDSFNQPITSISFVLTNSSGGKLTYMIGDPKLLIAGATGTTFTQPTSVRGSAVAAVQESFSSTPVAVAGLNYIVSNPSQYGETLRYWRADRDGRVFGKPINIDEFLRNNQEVATRQTLRFDQPYILDTYGGFALDVDDGVSVTMVLLLGANLV